MASDRAQVSGTQSRYRRLHTPKVTTYPEMARIMQCNVGSRGAGTPVVVCIMHVCTMTFICMGLSADVR